MWLIILIMWLIIIIIIIIKIIVLSIHTKFIMEVSNTWNLLFTCRMSVPFSFYSLLLPQPLSVFSTFSFRFSEILPHMRFFLFLIFLPMFSSITNSSFLFRGFFLFRFLDFRIFKNFRTSKIMSTVTAKSLRLLNLGF